MHLDPQAEKGQELKRFFKTAEVERMPHESIADFLVKYQEAVVRLSDKEVNLDDELKGWWLLEKCNLEQEQLARVIAYTHGQWSFKIVSEAFLFLFFVSLCSAFAFLPFSSTSPLTPLPPRIRLEAEGG